VIVENQNGESVVKPVIIGGYEDMKNFRELENYINAKMLDKGCPTEDYLIVMTKQQFDKITADYQALGTPRIGPDETITWFMDKTGHRIPIAISNAFPEDFVLLRTEKLP
jgi:hypothetical protein